MQIRNAQHADLAQVLELNRESVRFLSPLDAERLSLLHTLAAYHRVLQYEGRIAAFLLAFREGSAYDSTNYRWFAARYPRFLYIDRIVVSSSMQGRGAGSLFYEDLFAFARVNGVARVTCEIDLEPPNPASQVFHARRGFKQIGTRTYGPAEKLVSLQMVDLVADHGA